jgi:hypothetical protein
METMTIYIANGKRFDDPQEALAYERLCEQVDNITKVLTPRSQLLEDGCDYYEHDLSVVKDCFRKFCILCSKVIPSYKEWFLQTANGDMHISHIGRILSDYSHDYPILNKTLFRFDCISFENGYEFQQPYYVTHQEEFFKDMEKRLKYKNNGN